MLPELAALALARVAVTLVDADPARTAAVAGRALGPKLAGLLGSRLSDPGRKLPAALERSNRRAWQALRVALEGDGLFGRFAAADDRALRDHLRTHLLAVPLPGADAAFRKAALAELAAPDLLPLRDGRLDAGAVAAEVRGWDGLDDPAAVIARQGEWAGGLDAALARLNKPHLRRLLAGPPDGNVVVAAARYFFRREVERDPELFAGLTLSKLDALDGTLERGFAGLEAAFDRHGDRLEAALGDVREAVLDLREQMAGQSTQLQEIGEAVRQLLDAHHLSTRRAVRPGDSLSIRGDHERALVERLVARYRALPEHDRREVPALLDAVGKLGVVAGDFAGAERDFQGVADLVMDPRLKAEAHHNAHLAALERKDWDAAFAEMVQAVKLDARRLAPFPTDRFAVKRILGAGGFGTVYLCREKAGGVDRVVKALRLDALGRDPEAVFAEADALARIDHPNVIKLVASGWTDPAGKGRPYVVMDYFPGTTLEEHVRGFRPLDPAGAVPLLRRIAAGLEAAHAAGVLHRDVKPGNVLVKFAAGTWQVRLIDFGLAMTQTARAATQAPTGGPTLLGQSLAGTLDYAAPEQLGRRPEPVGPPADVYGWARTACFALFGTPQPLPSQWRGVPEALERLLEECLSEDPAGRPATLAAVRRRLDALDPDRPKPAEPLPVAKPVSVARAVRPARARKAGPGWVVWAAVGGVLAFCFLLAVGVGLAGRMNPTPAAPQAAAGLPPGWPPHVPYYGPPVTPPAFGPPGVLPGRGPAVGATPPAAAPDRLFGRWQAEFDPGLTLELTRGSGGRPAEARASRGGAAETATVFVFPDGTGGRWHVHPTGGPAGQYTFTLGADALTLTPAYQPAGSRGLFAGLAGRWRRVGP